MKIFGFGFVIGLAITGTNLALGMSEILAKALTLVAVSGLATGLAKGLAAGLGTALITDLGTTLETLEERAGITEAVFPHIVTELPETSEP